MLAGIAFLRNSRDISIMLSSLLTLPPFAEHAVWPSAPWLTETRYVNSDQRQRAHHLNLTDEAMMDAVMTDRSHLSPATKEATAWGSRERFAAEQGVTPSSVCFCWGGSQERGGEKKLKI